MPGLHLQVNGGVRATGGNGFSPTVPSNGSATAMGFGQGYTQSGDPSLAGTLAPNDAFGVAFMGGVIALVLLLVVRHSLPN